MITEVWLGIPITNDGAEQRQRLDQGYQLQPHDGHHRGRYVMAHRPQPQIRWTPEETAILESHWGFKSASAIGKILGRSKGSVIGRANRIGL